MGFAAAAGGLVAFLLSVPVVQANNTVYYSDSDICATKGSTTRMVCEDNNPNNVSVTKTIWFTKEVNNDPFDLTGDSDYKARATNRCPMPATCYLEITDLKESDSKTYKCSFFAEASGQKWIGEPGVHLTVTALQVNVIRARINSSHTEANLSCHSTCGGPSYAWYINGQEVPGESAFYTSYLKPGDGVTCSLISDWWNNHSPPLYGPRLPSVSVSPSEIVEGSSVTLTCSSDANPAANYTWYKEDEDSPTASGQIFIINDFRAEHSGSYSCEAQNNRGRSTSTFHLTVADTTTMIIHITRLTLVVVVPVSLLLLCLWMRKKKALISTTEPHEPIETVELDLYPVYEDVSDMAAQTGDTEEQEDRV